MSWARLVPSMLPLALAACAATDAGNDPASERIRDLFVREDRRDPGPELRSYLEAEEPELRARAARALGRIGDPDAVDVLAKRTSDHDRKVRLEAVFALGQVASERVPAALLPSRNDADPEVRARVLEALGKSGTAEHRGEVMAGLKDTDPKVRGTAALALDRLRRRLSTTSTPAEEARTFVAEALLDALGRELDPEARWRLAYTMTGYAGPAAKETLVVQSRADEVFTRLFAVRGLAVLEPDQDLLTVFLRRVDDEDPRVAYEAVQALTDPARRRRPGTTPDERSPFGAPEVFEALVRLLKSPDVHLRAAAVQGLSRFVDREYAVLQFIYDALASADPEVKAAAVEGLARLLRENAAGILRAEMKSPQWPVRASIAAGLRYIGTDSAIPLAGRLSEDEDVRVVQASLIALRDFPGQRDALDFTLRGLKRPEFGTREVAAETLAKIGDPSVLPALTRAYVESPGLPYTEARRAIVVAALAVGRDSPDLADLLQKAATDASPGIRGLATGRLATGSPVESSAGSEGRVTPLPGKDFEVAFLKARPRVEIVTRRGRFVVELLCEEAPIHCFNFLEIAKTGSYAGRLFHRVVPNFVVQGGDEKGDGSGATAYHGGRLRDEANPVSFLDGTVGMPKSDEKDSGGSQFFITLVPTPHLDGRYTAFGRVVEGMDAVMKLERGDVIERVQLLR